MFYIYIFNL